MASTADGETDPDQLMAHASVAEVRAIEQQTRVNIETRRKELRAMVGEQYLDLISAADAIIAMNKNARAVQDKLERMQHACDVGAIRQRATAAVQHGDDATDEKKHQRRLYVLAALVKSLADVPEQIWRALESHQYLHAGRLYTLARVVHDHLEQETDEDIHLDVVFPVVQRQWDAVSFFLPQILQKSTQHLRLPDLGPEAVADMLAVFMLLDSDQTYETTLHHLLEARRAAIHDICVSATEDRLSFQLREIVQIVQRTLIHIHAIFLGDTTLEHRVDQLRENFMLDGSVPPITRVFSARTNVHLLIRYLPPSVQNFTPDMAGCGAPLTPNTVRQNTQTWLRGIETLVREQLPTMLQPIQTHRALVDTRNRLWQVLDKEKRKSNTLVSSSSSSSSSWPKACEALLAETQKGDGYAIWDVLFRDAFNAHAEALVRQACDQLSTQPTSVVWPRLMDDASKKDFTLSCMSWPTSAQAAHKTSLLPNSASASEIQDFKRALTEVAHDRTRWLRDLQALFDQALQTMRTDMMSYIERDVNDPFHAKTDTQNILEYFKNTCAQAISQYAAGLQNLISDLNGWSDTAKANDLALFLGRLARILATFSDELVRTLSLSTTARYAGLELRSRVDLDPKCKELKATLMTTYHTAHTRWIETVSKRFERQLGSALARTQWNDENPGFLLWEDVGDDAMKLPTQGTNALLTVVYSLCDELQRVNSSMLDKDIMMMLRKALLEAAVRAAETIRNTTLTERGAIQLAFDIYLLNILLHEDEALASSLQPFMEHTQSYIDPINWAIIKPHLMPQVERFYLKQALILGILTRPSRDTLERSRKAGPSQQPSAIPLVPQAPRFTLLPVGHLGTTRIK